MLWEFSLIKNVNHHASITARLHGKWQHGVFTQTVSRVGLSSSGSFTSTEKQKVRLHWGQSHPERLIPTKNKLKNNNWRSLPDEQQHTSQQVQLHFTCCLICTQYCPSLKNVISSTWRIHVSCSTSLKFRLRIQWNLSDPWMQHADTYCVFVPFLLRVVGLPATGREDVLILLVPAPQHHFTCMRLQAKEHNRFSFDMGFKCRHSSFQTPSYCYKCILYPISSQDINYKSLLSFLILINIKVPAFFS